MIRRLPSPTLLIAFGLAAALTAAMPAAAKKGAPGHDTVEGKVSSISLTTRTLTVATARGTQTLLKVESSARLLRNGARANLSQLALRDLISARFDRRTLRLESARVRGPVIETSRGRLVEWDAASRQVELATAAGSQSFRFDGSTLLTRNGAAARPSDLRQGDRLTVHSKPGRAPQRAADIEAEGPEEGEIEGLITAIAGSDVTIDPEPGDPLVLHVDDTTAIRLHGQGAPVDGDLSDLEVGQKVEARFDPTTQVASRIDVENEREDEQEAEVEGELEAIDAGAGTFSITPEDGGADLALSSDDTTQITLDGEPASLGDLAVGSKAEARYDPTTGHASRLKVESEGEDGEDHEHDLAEVEGWVRAVSATEITIEPRGRSAVTLVIDPGTVIRIDGRIKTAADISVGDEAEARYDPVTLVASSLRIASHADGGDDHGGEEDD